VRAPRPLPRVAADQLGARVHAELAVDTCEEELDRPVREAEEPPASRLVILRGDLGDDLELVGAGSSPSHMCGAEGSAGSDEGPSAPSQQRVELRRTATCRIPSRAEA
jgi:hypothetical protein